MNYDVGGVEGGGEKVVGELTISKHDTSLRLVGKIKGKNIAFNKLQTVDVSTGLDRSSAKQVLVIQPLSLSKPRSCPSSPRLSDVSPFGFNMSAFSAEKCDIDDAVEKERFTTTSRDQVLKRMKVKTFSFQTKWHINTMHYLSALWRLSARVRWRMLDD